MANHTFWRRFRHFHHYMVRGGQFCAAGRLNVQAAQVGQNACLTICYATYLWRSSGECTPTAMVCNLCLIFAAQNSCWAREVRVLVARAAHVLFGGGWADGALWLDRVRKAQCGCCCTYGACTRTSGMVSCLSYLGGVSGCPATASEAHTLSLLFGAE